MKRNRVLVVPACLLLIMVLANTILAEQENKGKPSKAEVMQRTKKLQMPFIANEGQTDERVMFYANTFGGTVFVTKDGEIVYALPHRKNAGANAHRRHGNSHKPPINKREKGRITPPSPNGDAQEFDMNHSLPVPGSSGQTDPQHNKKQDTSVAQQEKGAKGVVLKEEIVGGRIDKIKGERKAITAVNDFRGKDPSKHKTNIPTYDVVTLGEVYEGVELKLKAYGNNVEKLFYVKSGADPGVIKLKLSGAKTLRVNEEGQLEAETALGTVKFTKPTVYQEPKVPSPATKENTSSSHIAGKGRGVGDVGDRQYIESTYVVTGNEYSFKLGDYDRAKGLVIDPLLASTYLGGSGGFGYDFGNVLKIDTNGYIYIAGNTWSSNFPTSIGAYDNFINYSSSEAFVSKFSGDLTSLLASTYLGGSDRDSLSSLAIDGNGNIYVVGETWSSDFPTTNDAYDSSYNGGGYYDDKGEYHEGGDAFVSKLDGNLTSLLASTYLGGSANDGAFSIGINSDGNIYVAGWTSSSDFPTTTGAYDTSYAYWDAFAAKLNSDLTILQASTYLGGYGADEYCSSITIDADENVYVTGWTLSSDFPTTPGAYDTSFSGYSNAFLSKLNDDLTSLLASTYLGSGYDEGHSMAIDAGGNIYVTGLTLSSGFPTTTGAYDTSFNSSGSTDAFVSKFSADLTDLLASTYLGGLGDDSGNSIAIGFDGNIYVAGITRSPDFPTSSGVYDANYNGGNYDAFVTKLSADLTDLLASTYLGGLYDDSGNSIAIGSDGNIYVTGYTESSDFPTTPNAYDSSYNGATDVFVSRFNSDLSNISSSTYLGGSTGYDAGNSIAIDKSGHIYVTGWTTSSDFPTTNGAYDASYNGGGYDYDVIISRLNTDLTELLASTYLGGLGDDTGNSITIDSDGNSYVAGYTNSSDFPTTPGAYDTSYNNGSAFISKLSGDLTDLLASTYLGGSSSYSSGNSMVTDSNGNIYVANVSSILKLDETLTNLLASTTLSGGTVGAMAISLSGNIYVTGIAGSNFQTTPDAYDTSFNGSDGSGSTDAFVSKLSADLKDLLASTYLGGLNSDSGNSIATGFDGNIYVTGETFSSDFPTTPGAYDDSLNYSDAFISKLSEDLTSLLASTYLGGAEGSSSGNSIAIDSAGGIFVTGWTQSSNFPTTIDAYDTSYGGGGADDVFVSKLSRDLKNLLASTYLGGSGAEVGKSIAINYNGNVYVGGSTYSSDFPISADAYDTFNNEIYHGDIFVSRFDSNLSANPVTVPYVNTNLDVDGNLSESDWNIATDVSNVVIGTTNNTTNFGVLWDSTYLYIGMTVLDDNLYNDSTYVHEDDSVEIYIDGDHNHSTTYDSYDRQFVKGWNDSTLVEQHGQKTGVLHGWAPISGGYSIELAIPWSNLGIIPTVGMTLGFSVGYNDDDNGVGRDGQAVWIGTANNWLDTSAFGDIILGEASPQTPTPAITPTPTLVYTPTSTPTPTPSSTPVVTPTLTPIPTPLTSGLEAHYMFDEGMGTSAHDSSGTGNHGTINGATWTTGKSGGALSFDGNDYVQIPGLLGQPKNITISAWVQLNAKDTSGAEVISLGDHVAIRLDGSNGSRGFYYDCTTWRTTTTGVSYAGTGWHHFVYVVDDTNNIQKVYVDGAEKGSTAYTQSISYTGLGSNTFIGKHANGSSNYDFNGTIDDVRVYNNAMSAQEVLDLYNQSSSGLVSHWKLDEGGGTHATDSAGGNDGTINGAMWTGCELSLDGVNDYVTTTSPSSALKPLSQVAVSAWIKTSATDTKSGEVVSMGDSYGLRVKTNGSVLFFYYDGSTWRGVSTTGVNVHDGKWHHIIGQKSSSVLQVYIDGVLKGSLNNTGTIAYTLGTGFFIGKHGMGNTLYDFKGTIDDVRVYGRTLSVQEVQELYNTFASSGIMALVSRNHGDNNINFIPKVAATPMHPTITLRSFKAGADDGRVTLTWETSGETDSAGFNLYRARRRNGTYTQVNAALIDAKGDVTSGGSYSFEDQPGRGNFYYYKLESVDYDGVSTVHKPVKAKVRSEDTPKYRSGRKQP